MSTIKSESYLKFDMSRMVNLEYSLNREILRTNRKGAYHCTTLVECNTRKQHGLLVMPIPQKANARHVLLSSFDETVIQHEAEFNLGIHKYDGNNFNPMGHKYIREFNYDFLPKTIYRVGGVILSKEKLFSLDMNTIFIRYTLLDAHSQTSIRFKPFLAFREINDLTFENPNANLGYAEVKNGVKCCMYPGFPDLHMQFSKKVKFVSSPHWNKGIEYQKDMDDGMPYKEDLFVPGYFELNIKKGEQVVFAASDTILDGDLHSLFNDNMKKRKPRCSFWGCLNNSACQFYINPQNNDFYLTDGYPWGKLNARKQFMALAGLTLELGNPDIFENIVDTASLPISLFMKGKPYDSLVEDLDAPDVLLWLMRALKIYSLADEQRFYEKYAKLAIDIIEFIAKNKHPYLKVLDDSKLICIDGYDKPASWMDGMYDGKPVVERSGCLVELNAFWFEGLMFVSEIAAHIKKSALQKKMSVLADKVQKSFHDTFLNDAGYLYDYVDYGYAERSVRPNMLMAIAITYPLLDKRQTKSVLDIVTKELLTAKGIRSLSPKSFGYRPLIEGDHAMRVVSEYNGGAWPWLLGAYFHAYNKIFHNRGVLFLDRILIRIEEEMRNDCIGSLSEVYDSGFPYLGHGAISSSLNIGGVIRAYKLLQTISSEIEED